MRRRSEWSKWIPTSADHQTSPGSSDGKSDSITENRGDCAEGLKEVPSSNALGPMQVGENCTRESVGDNTDQNRGKASFSGITSGNNSIMGMDFHLDNNTYELNWIMNKIYQISHKGLTQQSQVLIKTAKTKVCRLIRATMCA